MQLGRMAAALRRCRAHSAVRVAARALSGSSRPPQNLVEKIVQRHVIPKADGTVEWVRAGQALAIRPSYVMTHDNTAAVMPKFLGLGAARIANPLQVVFTLDHNVQDKTEGNLAKYRAIEEFAAEHGVDFYPAGRGIGHQVMCEEGYAYPYRMVVASDSHSNMYGGLGCLGTPVVRTDAAGIWATGSTWWQVPNVARVEFTGQLEPGVTGKDVIIALCGLFNSDEVLNHAVEFCGDGVRHLSVDERLTIANMSTEWGALAGVFPVDDVTLAWLEARAAFLAKRGPAGVPSDMSGGVGERCGPGAVARVRELAPEMKADKGCVYSTLITLDLSTVRPHVSGPNDVKLATPVDRVAAQRVAINKAYLVSCVNSRREDIAAAAAVVRGKRVADGVEMYVAAASSEVQAQSEEAGDWQALLDAGAIPLPPGCGPCIGLGKGILEDGEVGVSATNRNFVGRMGAKSAKAYLASPAVVAASAVAGYITGPREYGEAETKFTVTTASPREGGGSGGAVEVVPGFPELISGRAILCPSDDINTDGIYPGKYTYREDMSPEEMGAVAMENYDGGFQALVRRGDVLVAGYNFGTGSSREQAATALKAAGVAAVVCGSANKTYQRNAVNNGLIVIECPAALERVLAHLGGGAAAGTGGGPTVVPGLDLSIDLAAGEITVVGLDGGPFPFRAFDQVCQELIAVGGLESWIRAQLPPAAAT